MELSVILTNIESLLEQQKRSADAVSREAGHPDAIRNLRRAIDRGKGGISLRTLSDLARALKTSRYALLKPRGSSDGSFTLQAPHPSDQHILEFLMEQQKLIERQIEEVMSKPPLKKRAGR